MYDWDLFENVLDIQVIPEGEYELHQFNTKCSCRPEISKRYFDDKIVYSHFSIFNGKVFEKAEKVAQIFYPFKENIKDC